MTDEMQQLQVQVKNSISTLIANGKLQEAEQLLNQYADMAKDDIEVFSIRAVIAIQTGNLAEAQNNLETGLRIDNDNFDLLYNLAYVYERQERKQEAYSLYLKLKGYGNHGEYHDLVLEGAQRLEKFVVSGHEKNDYKQKMTFFVKEGMDSFIGEIINHLTSEYEIKKVIVSDLRQIEEEMQWADICWFEWCDELVIYGSKLSLAQEKKIICRLHSYEAFIEYPGNVNWGNVDKVIFVAEHIRSFVLENTPTLLKEKTMVIPNGIDISKYKFKERKKGFNIAYVGYINYKKGPMLLLHVFQAIFDRDSRYKLFIAGTFQDARYVLYFRQMIKEMGLSNNVFYQGWQDNVDEWLEDKDYIISTSVLEGHPMSIMQAMAKGIKPLVHNFVGARDIYPEQYVWSTIDECVKKLKTPYDSQVYKNFIEKKYTLSKQIENINNVIRQEKPSIPSVESVNPLVTIGIINYNNAKYLRECVQSFTNQKYGNLEIIIVDDNSSDDSKRVILELKNEYSNIKAIFHEVNSGGPSKATQEIISNARGKYVQWISSDDFVMNNSIKRFMGFLEENPDFDYVYSNFNIVDEHSKIKDQWVYSEYSPEEIIQRVFHSGSGVLPTICLFRVSFFRNNNIPWIIYRNNDLHSDTLNSLQFLKYNLRYKKLEEYLICYRLHNSNISYSIKMRIKGAISIFDYIIKNFDERIYLPEINWSTLDQSHNNKNLVLAQFYYSQAKDYLSNMPDYIKQGEPPEESIDHYVFPFVKEAYEYISAGLKQDSIYRKELLELEKKLGDFAMYNKYEHIKSIKELGAQIAQLNGYLSNEQEAKTFYSTRQRIGYVDSVIKNHLHKDSLIHYHKNVFSQAGQDGILEEIFSRIGIDTGLFVEFGGWDGIYLSNCRYLALQGWKGIFIEADNQKYKELCANYKDNDDIIPVNKFVNFEGKDTLDEILKLYGINEVDFLSIDIDGLDYKIMETMHIRPKVILMEGGAAFSPYLMVRIPDNIAQENLSQPLPILLNIIDKMNYTAVCFYQDLYLVRNDLAGDFVNCNNSPVELYRDWFLSIPPFNRKYMTDYVRRDTEDCIIKKIETEYFKTYRSNPLGYGKEK